MKWVDVQNLARSDAQFRKALELHASRVKRQFTKARQQYVDFHWSDEPERVQRVTIPEIQAGDAIYSLGELVSVTYRARKNRDLYDWHHEFENHRPELAATTSGHLVIVGGDYAIEPEGIVG